MTNDQFGSDQNDFDLAADSSDGFDAVVADSKPQKRKSRAPFLLFLLLIIGGAAFAAYKVFLGGDMNDFAAMRANDMSPPQQVAAPAPASNLPEGVTPSTETAQPSGGLNVQEMLANNLNPAAPVNATAEAPVADMAVTPVVPEAAPETATTTEATALPSPAADAAPADTAVTTPAMPEAAPVAAEASVTATPEVKTADVTMPAAVTDTATTTPPADEVKTESVVADIPVTPTAAEDVLAKAATPAPTPAMPAPAQDQLKPIDATVTPPTAAQTQKTADAVKEILGKDAIVSDQVKQAQTAKMTEPTEVTPHAREVIVVKKAYSASSSQAVNAAGGRILAAGQYNEAADMFDSQLKKNPSDPLALAGKAQALQRAGRVDEALRTYDRLLQLNPRDLEALTNSLGLVQQQNPQKALTKLQSMVQQYPDNAAVAGQLATTQARLMDTPNALRNFQKAMALDPTNPTYPFNMAVLYDRLGSVDKARATYRQALDVAGAYPHKASNVPLQVIRDRMASIGN